MLITIIRYEFVAERVVSGIAAHRRPPAADVAVPPVGAIVTGRAFARRPPASDRSPTVDGALSSRLVSSSDLSRRAAAVTLPSSVPAAVGRTRRMASVSIPSVMRGRGRPAAPAATLDVTDLADDSSLSLARIHIITTLNTLFNFIV